jgi:hypothetical protein
LKAERAVLRFFMHVPQSGDFVLRARGFVLQVGKHVSQGLSRSSAFEEMRFTDVYLSTKMG